MTDLHADDPARDYRRRYELPDQFVWDIADWPRIDFDGYTSVALRLLPPPPARVLDVGSGPGMVARRLVEHGYDVTGVDFNERAVAFGELLVPGATMRHGDIRHLNDLPLSGPFDAALCVEVLEHVPPEDRRLVIASVRSVLREGGTFVLTTPTPRMWPNPWDYRRASRHELEHMLESDGFEVRTVAFQHRMTPWFSPAAWRLWSNRAYDVRVIRRLLRRVFLHRWNEVADESRAGRYVIEAVAR
jgi:SAM-dependent methyltransferase